MGDTFGVSCRKQWTSRPTPARRSNVGRSGPGAEVFHSAWYTLRLPSRSNPPPANCQSFHWLGSQVCPNPSHSPMEPLPHSAHIDSIAPPARRLAIQLTYTHINCYCCEALANDGPGMGEWVNEWMGEWANKWMGGWVSDGLPATAIACLGPTSTADACPYSDSIFIILTECTEKSSYRFGKNYIVVLWYQ